MTDSPESSQASATPTQAQQPGNTEKGNALPSISPEQARRLSDRLGIPSALRNIEVPTEEAQAEPEASEVTQPEVATEPTEVAGEDAKPEGEAEPHEGEPGEGAEETEESEEEIQSEQDPKLQKLKRKNYSLRKRAQKAEAEAYANQARAEEAEARLGQGPVVMPTNDNPLAHVNDLTTLEREIGQFKQLQEQAEDHPEGWIAHEGTPQEHFVTPEQAKYLKRWAKGVIENDGARKKVELERVRPAARAEAEKIMPSMFKRGTEEFEAAASLQRDIPWLATDPRRDHLTAIFLKGWRAINESSNGTKLPEKLLRAQQTKGNGVAKASTPPSRPSGLPNGNKPMGAVLDGVAKAGGSSEALQAGLKAIRGLSNGPKARELATV